MSKIIERIALIIDSKGISNRAFEMSIGASNGMIGRAVSKGTDIMSEWLSRIIEIYPDISSEWLLTGKGAMQQGGRTTPVVVDTPSPDQIVSTCHDPRDIEKIKYLEDMLAITRDALHECKESKADKDARIADKDRMISDRDEIIKDCRKEKERSDQYTRRLEAENMQLKFSPGSKRTSGLPFDVGLGDAPVDEL